MNSTGVIIRPSAYSVKETIERLTDFLTQHGATVYLQIDQQREFLTVGIKINPYKFILFGNPRAGAALVRENPVAGLDLPLKVIAWEDNHGKVWLGYNDACYLEERHNLIPDKDSPLDLSELLTKALDIRI